MFQSTDILKPSRSAFDLSYDKLFTCDMGQLIPVMCDEVFPADTFTVGNAAVVRFQPLVAPVMHEINLYTHYFFVPYRLLWDDFENFISGGVDGDFTTLLPRYVPTDRRNATTVSDKGTQIGTLWDYLGFPSVPLGLPSGANVEDFKRTYDNLADDSDHPLFPHAMPQLAYNLVYNEYYRDQNLMEEVSPYNNSILHRCWRKDYFTSALPFRQRGVAPAIPLSGTLNAVFPPADLPDITVGVSRNGNRNSMFTRWTSRPAPDYKYYWQQGEQNALTINTLPRGLNDPETLSLQLSSRLPNAELTAYLNTNKIDASNIGTFDVNEFRTAFALQKFVERNARGGVRYTEFLRSHFGVSPRDERLQRPEYIGGTKSPVVISEVLQTSSSVDGSPQGNLAGHGITARKGFAGKYHAQEYGLIIGLMSIMPKSVYSQGVDRQWLHKNRYDFYFREFANLGEQAVHTGEIYFSNSKKDIEKFGFQGIYDYARHKRSIICGQMRHEFDYWHLARDFEGQPYLNESFLVCKPSKRIFAVPSEPGLIVWFGNNLKAVRPMPKKAIPGLIDHF